MNLQKSPNGIDFIVDLFEPLKMYMYTFMSSNTKTKYFKTNYTSKPNTLYDLSSTILRKAADNCMEKKII